MASPERRPILRLSGQELVRADEDRRVEIGVYDFLLPCRKYEITYKVAVLGNVSPSLEFLLRLVKALPGISDDVVETFFGYSRAEMTYVLDEAIEPGYVERRDGRLWLTGAGDALFRDGEEVPSIFAVEDRRRAVGFDLLAIAPERPRRLDHHELWLPELPIEEDAGTGQVASRIGGQFSRFFHEFSERADREQVQRRDLYSIDEVVPKERFQTSVRLRVFAQASAPSLPEIDLGAWRPDHEVADRPQVESAAAMLIDDLKISPNHLDAPAGYDVLGRLAPEFFKEFLTQKGLSVSRYWREAVGRAGEPRSDRQTVAIVGPLYTEDNARRLSSVLEYGLRDKKPVESRGIISVAPQARFWGATMQQRDTLSLLKRMIGKASGIDGSEIMSACLYPGKPPRYLEGAFERIRSSDTLAFPGSLEVLLVPRTAVSVVVHSPIGAATGQAVALGFASFDAQVIRRAQVYVREFLPLFVPDEAECRQYIDAMSDPPPT